ncbi:MAG: hypothetical protein K2X81_08230, partial [Candidatus Obscuribacterales bacterium]|nr:hypothetical protein [Candidatus Obscuribacterales bacterium]
MSTVLEPLELAKDKFAQGDMSECLRQLTFAFIQDTDNTECYSLAIMCLRQLGSENEAKLFENALANFDDARAFFDLGYHFIDVGHERLAIPLLLRAFRLAPGDSKIALELAIALCGQFQPRAAREALLQCKLDSNFWISYQFHWSSLLCGITDGAEAFIKESRRTFLAQTATHEIKGALYALDKLDELRLRFSVVKKPEAHIMHWHFIQYGSAILDYFDDSMGQQGLQVAGGRWVYVGISYLQLNVTLLKLKRLLAELGRTPSIVLSVPDRDSIIIANGISRILGLPMTVVPDMENTAWEESLLVAANNWNFSGAPLERVMKNQIVFAFNHNWLEQGPNTPDIIGMMSQYCTWPWSKERLVIDPVTNERTEAVEDSREPEEIALEFSKELDEKDIAFDDVLEFYKK